MIWAFVGHSFGFRAEDGARRRQSSLINTVTLAFGAGSKPIKIHAGQTGIGRRNSVQRTPEDPFSVNSEHQKFERFEGSETFRRALFQFQPAHFLRQPCAPFFHSAGNKPAGLLAVPIKGSDTPSALSLLVAKLKLKRQRALVVHRIDRFASGALLFAKTSPDRDALVRQFLDHTPVRQYLAVLRGRLDLEAGTLVHYFRREGDTERGINNPEVIRSR